MNAPLRWTEDGGATWNPACFPEGYSGSVSTLAFQGERGWAVVHAAGDTEASSLMGTTDGGRHWRVLPFPESASRIADLAFVDGDHGWAVGTRPATTGNPLTGSGGLVLRTEDSGTTWTFQQLPEDVTGGLRHVSFMDRRHGWATGQTAAGAPVALATADGGATWTARPLPAGVYNVSGVAFADEAHGWVVGLVANNAAPPDNQAAVILATADGGGTWTEQSRTPGITLWNVGLLDAGHAWAAGGGIGGTLLTTADGGTTWRQWSAGRKALQTAFFTDPMHGWAGTVQGSCLLSTADGGASWDLHPVDPPGCTGFQ